MLGGFHGPAVSRAYYAAFYAAEAALHALDESRSKHSGVMAAFRSIVVGRHGFDDDVGRLLPSLFDRRNTADYAEAPVDRSEVEEAIADAERFVDAVEAWLEGLASSA
jgi:uncharacterized protein (UPF0332 family)